ncbi:hypothetical protein Bbelb_295470 [Branchiostoma belcheri]|nr:hypothetical protein Bbelb_295470 [Branchiostoma belcheri]
MAYRRREERNPETGMKSILAVVVERRELHMPASKAVISVALVSVDRHLMIEILYEISPPTGELPGQAVDSSTHAGLQNTDESVYRCPLTVLRASEASLSPARLRRARPPRLVMQVGNVGYAFWGPY